MFTKVLERVTAAVERGCSKVSPEATKARQALSSGRRSSLSDFLSDFLSAKMRRQQTVVSPVSGLPLLAG